MHTSTTEPTTKKLQLFGPGGIKCRCCTPFSNQRKNRRLANRAVRREGKRLVLQFSFEAL
jgi:hypothetical protein